MNLYALPRGQRRQGERAGQAGGGIRYSGYSTDQALAGGADRDRAAPAVRNPLVPRR